VLALLALLVSGADAASLDLIDVGGLWGTPNATDPTAVWWNPAALGAGSGGIQFLVEGAPTLANISFERTDPYYPGEDQFGFFGVVPFLGLSSDFGVDGLGVGVSFFVPYAASAKSKNEGGGVGSYHIVDGGIQATQLNLAVGYQFADIFSVGFGGGMLFSQYGAELDIESVTSLYDALEEIGLGDPIYDDSWVENPNYATRTFFGPMHGTGFVFNAGLHVQPTSKLAISASYNHGTYVNHSGDVNLNFGCPDETEDSLGNLGAQLYGICNAIIDADGTIGYAYPGRVNAGIQFSPIEPLTLELMGAYVMWSQFTEFDIDVTNPVKSPEDTTGTELIEASKALIAQPRPWSRDNRDSFFVGLDAKGQVNDWFLLGGRVTYDHAAVPDQVLSPNNYDAPRIHLGLLGAFEVTKGLQIATSYTHNFLMTRTITDSDFSVTIDPSQREAMPYLYPSSTGTYKASIYRFGVSIRGKFLEKNKGA
jgi:long-subunit fatty acid transport protein